MIRIRSSPDVLDSFTTPKVERLKKQLCEKVANCEELTNDDIDDSVWKTQEVKNALFASQKRKCCFCENKRAKKREFDGEHFRPKLGVTEEPEHLGYWWLAYEWNNIFYACKPCNQEFKKNQFPITGERAFNKDDSLQNEQPLLIHPTDENPEEFIGFDWQMAYGKLVKATGIDDNNRGNETIRITGLNRLELMEERAESVTLLEDAAYLMEYYSRNKGETIIQRYGEKIRELTSSNRRFAGFNRAFFRARGLGQYISDD
ncbi:MAG: hypothetical protein QQN41_04165 [Nitrosopumilus sp.]